MPKAAGTDSAFQRVIRRPAKGRAPRTGALLAVDVKLKYLKESRSSRGGWR